MFSKINKFLSKKLLAVGLCLVLFLSTPIHSYATESEATVSPRFSYIATYSLSLSFNNDSACCFLLLKIRK